MERKFNQLANPCVWPMKKKEGDFTDQHQSSGNEDLLHTYYTEVFCVYFSNST